MSGTTLSDCRRRYQCHGPRLEIYDGSLSSTPKRQVDVQDRDEAEVSVYVYRKVLGLKRGRVQMAVHFLRFDLTAIGFIQRFHLFE
jgi:hypothetical protein